MGLIFMIVLILAVGYGVYRYSKWVRRDRPSAGPGGPVDDDLPTDPSNHEK